jgi:hypothetical protein
VGCEGEKLITAADKEIFKPSFLEEDGREVVGEVVWIILVTVQKLLRCLGLCAVLSTHSDCTLALSSFKSLWQFNVMVTIHFRVKDGTHSASKDHHHRSEDSLLAAPTSIAISISGLTASM